MNITGVNEHLKVDLFGIVKELRAQRAGILFFIFYFIVLCFLSFVFCFFM